MASPRWVDAQRETPSFASAPLASPDMPAMPRSIMDGSPSKGSVALFGTGAPGTDGFSPVPVPGAAAGSGAVGRGGTLSRSRTPAKVVDSLLTRGRLYEERREALREQQAVKDEESLKRPALSQMAKELKRSQPVTQRLYRLTAERQLEAEQKMEEDIAREEKVMATWFKPRISKKGGTTRGRAMNDSRKEAQNQQRREEAIAERRRQIALEELSQLQEGPVINSRSEMLAASKREKEGMAGYGHAEAMLERDRLQKLRRWEDQQRQEYESRRAATPRITARAARSGGGGGPGDSVFDRLANDQFARAERAEQRRLEASERAQSAGPSTARLPPPSSASSFADGGSVLAAGRGAGSVAERGAAFAAKREARLEAIREAERKTHNPATNPVSAAIAARLPDSTFERLTGANGSVAGSASRPSATPVDGVQWHGPGAAARTSAEPSGHGYGNPHHYHQGGDAAYSRGDLSLSSPPPGYHQHFSAAGPRAAAGGSPAPGSLAADPTAVYDRLTAAAARRDQRVKAERQRLAEEQAAECTFKPATTATAPRYSNAAMSADAALCSQSSSGIDGGDFDGRRAYGESHVGVQDASVGPDALQRLYARTTQWQRRRDERLAQARMEQDAGATSDCTFAPATLGLGGGGAAVAAAAAAPAAKPEPAGYAAFVERLATARRDKDTEGTSPVPQHMPQHRSPALGQRTYVPSLDPPVRPPAFVPGAAPEAGAPHATKGGFAAAMPPAVAAAQAHLAAPAAADESAFGVGSYDGVSPGAAERLAAHLMTMSGNTPHGV